MSSALNRRQFSSALAGALAAGPQSLKAQRKRPNILFLMTDEHRGDCLHAVGHRMVRTPNFDRLARDGALLRNFFTASPVCSPARVSAFTGRYPKSHGVRGNGQPIGAGETLLPKLLKEHGYRTGLAGKLHFAPQDAAGLFDFHQEFPAQYNAFLKENYPDRSLNQTRQSYRRRPTWLVGTSPIPARDFPTAWIADRAIEFIGEGEADEPWFCFVSFWKPHSPYVLPMPWSKMYDPKALAVPELPSERPTPPTASNRDRHYITADQVRELKSIRAAYYGAVSFVDEQIGRIIKELRRLGQLDNTIIVFTSDHGNSLGEHGRMFKGTPYEGAIHVPCIFRYPAAIPASRSLGRLADTTSILPTLLDLAGLPPAEGCESGSLKRVLASHDPDWDDTIFTEMLFHTIRTRDWKLTLPGDHPTWEAQLFDLNNDPGETTNLYSKPEAAKVQRELTARLEKWSAGKR